MIANFSIEGISVTETLSMEEEGPSTERRYNLVLRSDRHTRIRLSSGESLKDVDVHFTLSSKWASPEKLGRELKDRNVGFLIHTRDTGMPLIERTLENSEPFIHGAAIWPSNYLPDALFQPTIKGFISMTFSSVQEVFDGEEPFIWDCNRPHAIHISDVSVSAIRPEHEDETLNSD